MRQRSKSFHFDKISVSDSESEAEHETDENEDEEAGEEAGEEWSAEEKKELLENIKRNFKERNKTYIIPLKKLDWTKIATTRTANETQTYFMELLKKIRKIRSLTEILDDPITWYGDPQSRTGQQSVYSLWNKDNYDRVLAAAGSTSLVARARAAASLYATITPEEKARYYAMLPPRRPQIKPLSKRITAFNLYHKHRRENKSAFEIPPYPQVRQDWNNLSIKERIPFIREVFAIAKQTGEEPQITKFEQKILDTDESRPLSPQTSLEIFKSEIRGTLGKNMIDKSKKASVLYKKLPKKEMKKYEEKAKKMKEEYVDKFAQWVQSLPEERREFEIAGLQENCNKKSTHKTMKKVLLAKIASLPVKNESITSESANGSSTDINMSPIKQNKKKATHKKKIQKNNESMRTMSESEIKNEPDSELMSYLVPLISYSPDNTLSATKKKHKNAELGISQVANESAAEPKVKNKNSKSVKENEVPNQETPVKNKNSKSVKENEVPNQDSPKMSSKSKKNVPGKVIAKGKKNVPMTVIPTSSSSEDESPPMKTASRAKAPPFKKIKSEPLSSENESIVNKKAKFTPGEMPEFDYNTPFDFWKGNIYKGKKAAAESAYAKLSEKLKQKYAQKFQLKQNEYLIALKDYLIQLPAASLREISATKIIKTEKDDVVEASDDGESASESETESD